jgi:predicted amidohydrolase
MKVALIQTALYWEKPKENRFHFDQIINSIAESIDLIVLPEMFTTGFTMNAHDMAESSSGETTLWLQALARSKNCAITGSIVIKENGNYYNRLLFVFPSGEIKTYDKRHLFTLAGEDKIYTAGNKKTIVDYNGFRICPQICYDLRFPVFSRNTEGYDLLIYVANWPNVRISAWDCLLKARAIENQCFVIGVNRIGEDNNHHCYNGHSQAIDYQGNYLLEKNDSNGFFIVDLDKSNLLSFREKFNFLSDRDRFTLSE